MNKINLWFRAVRPFTFTTSLLSVLLGAGLAIRDEGFSFKLFLLTAVGILLLHSGTNLINDYYDYQSGVDTGDAPGSRGILTSNLIAPWKVKLVGVICFLLVIPIIVYLIYVRGIIVGILGIIGGLGGYFYTAEPVNYKYYALGLPLVFTLLGPLVVIGSYYVQTEKISYEAILFSLPLGLLVIAILHGNDLRDFDYDNQVEIKTLALFLGRKLAGRLYLMLVMLPYVILISLAAVGTVTPWALGTLITFPYALKNSLLVNKAASNPEYEIKQIDLKTAKLHFSFGTLLILALIATKFL